MALCVTIGKAKRACIVVPNRDRINPLLDLGIQCPWAEVRSTMPSCVLRSLLHEQVFVAGIGDLGKLSDVQSRAVGPR